MIRDRGPLFQLGYGVTSRDLPYDPDETEGPNPQSGVISKALHHHPVMRFFATSAATMVGMAVGGALIKKGGINLAIQLQESNKTWVTSALSDFRKIQNALDDLQGARRIFAENLAGAADHVDVDYSTAKKFFVKDPNTGKLIGDTLDNERTGFFFTKGEVADSKSQIGEGLTEWTYKDQIQKNLVGAARRLPYELPAGYFVQRTLADPLFGTDSKNQFQGDWYNPLDLMTDFVKQSVRNVATMVVPFEVGGAVASQGMKNFMTLGDDFTNLSPRQKNYAETGVAIQNVLQRVGQDAVGLLNNAARVSSQSTGALATGLEAARNSAYSLTEYLHDTRHGQNQISLDANASIFEKVQNKLNLSPKLFDLLPGPFKGSYTGFQAGKLRFQEIGQGYEAFQNLMDLGQSGWSDMAKGGKLMNAFGLPDPSLPMQNALKKHMGGLFTPIEELANQTNTLGRGGVGSAAFESSPFFNDLLQKEYNDVLQRNLKKAGMSEKAAQDFSQMVRVSKPIATTTPSDITTRFLFGQEKVIGNNPNEVFSQIYKKVGSSSGVGMPSVTSAAQFSSQFGAIVNATDKTYLGEAFQKQLRSKTAAQWSMLEDRILPQIGSRLIDKTKPLWSEFSGDMDEQHLAFLRRKTAEVTGLKLTDTKGNVVSDAIIDSHLRKMQFNPSDTQTMTSYLATKGQIGKPWQQAGFNVFGLRKLSVAEASKKGYFDTRAYNEGQVNKLVNRMAINDPIPLGNYTVKGAYVTASGRVVDFNKIKRGFSAAMQKADDLQAPLVHLPFMQTAGFTAKKDISERSILQFASGSSNQPFINRADANDDFHLWVRDRAKGSRGTVFSFGVDSQGLLRADELQGNYRPLAAKASNIASRQAKMAAGNMGKGPVDPADQNGFLHRILGDQRFQDIRSKFSISNDQPDSLFRFTNRFKNRQTDINNPIAMAGLLRDGEIKYKNTTLRLVNGTVVDQDNHVIHDVSSFNSAFNSFASRLRRRGFSQKTIDGFRSDQGSVSQAFVHDFTGMPAKSFAAGKVDVSALNSPNQILEAANLIYQHDRGVLDKFTPDKANPIRKALDSLLGTHTKESGTTEFWNRTLPGSRGNTTGAINTRIDELKSDLLKYLTIRSGIANENFSDVISESSLKLMDLKRTGKISQAEFIEARAALLSTQINYHSFTTYSRTQSSGASARALFNKVTNNPAMQKGLTDIQQGRSTIANGRLGRIKPFLRRKFGTAPYKYPGSEYSPFGDTNTVFVPTFSTAAARGEHGLFNAVRSVVGSKTWDNPNAFSGSAIPMGHFVERLNKFSSIFGLSLNPTDFKGPIDLYARGMIVKRALPIVAGATALVAVDRTIGGFTNEKDVNGKRVYSPYFLGKAARPIAELEAATAILPGGESYQQKRHDIFEGEVPIRSGRWWPLGSTPWKGGRIDYFRPSWYRRLQAGHMYTDQTYGSPLERLAFGDDFSPLRPFDPNRFEREHYQDRPYPETGDYFTGPWGPLTPLLNTTVGRILKPKHMMHQAELAQGMEDYQPVGEQGMYIPSNTVVSGLRPSRNAPMASGGAYSGFGGGGGIGGAGGGIAGAQNARYASAGRYSRGTAAGIVNRDISGFNKTLTDAAQQGPPSGEYGVGSEASVIRPEILASGKILSKHSFQYQLGNLGYKSQEMLGIYGFAFSSVRSSLGFGNKDFDPNRSTLASPNAAYGSTRGFWDLGLGGLGDTPLPVEGNYANFELSEMIRRFVPKERSGTQTINPIINSMASQYPWLPGSDYYLNFKQGDPYSKVLEGEMRLPGEGYERFNSLHSDKTGRYGLVDQHKILGDIAPWSIEYKQIDNMLNDGSLNSSERESVETTREQVAQKNINHVFTPYQYKYTSAKEMLKNPIAFGIGSAWENFAHSDSYFNTKFLPERTAVEDWERQNVFGATFPEWQHPIKDFLRPMLYKATERSPIAATLAVGTVGSLFGRTAEMKTVGSLIGGAVGLGASMYGRAYNEITGQRFIPAERRKEIALDEYTDILSYTKNMRLATEARQTGDDYSAAQYQQQAQQTMYGADIYNGSIDQLAMAIPKRKRENFKAMITAPEQEHAQILSTAGRLERRIYEAAWGKDVEERPDLTSYFKQHELPPPDWEGWHPNTNMDDVKIKMAQSMGIELSNMGYYPQQARESNLINPSYPNFNGPENNKVAQIRRLMMQYGISGDVTASPSSYSNDRVRYNAGVLSGV